MVEVGEFCVATDDPPGWDAADGDVRPNPLCDADVVATAGRQTRGRNEIEVGFLAQNSPFQLDQFCAGVDAQLARQHGTGPLIRPKRIGLPP